MGYVKRICLGSGRGAFCQREFIIETSILSLLFDLYFENYSQSAWNEIYNPWNALLLLVLSSEIFYNTLLLVQNLIKTNSQDIRTMYQQKLFWWLPMPEKCMYSMFFWSVFFWIWTKYGEIRSISIQMLENTDQKNSEYGHYSRSVHYSHWTSIRFLRCWSCNIFTPVKYIIP